MRRTKEFRLAQKQRIRAKWLKRIRAKKYFNDITESRIPRMIYGDKLRPAELSKLIGIVSTTPKTTQCQCCCSPRYSCWYNEEEKLTLQERRDKRKVDYDLHEEALMD